MNSVIPTLAIGLASASLAMAMLWAVQRRTENAGIVDVAWAALTGTLGVFNAVAIRREDIEWLRYLAAVMIATWSVRLTVHLYRRVVGHSEEGRYVALRQRWGNDAQRRFFWFFQMQAFAAWFFATPLVAIAISPAPPSPWVVALALMLWLVGVGGVALADWQLDRFKRSATARGRTCRTGLWRYSRHPNYFFEWLHWCSYIPLAAASPGWWAPLLVAGGLLYLLLFVTGIPPTEAQALASRGDDYRDYQRTTSAFVPWAPKAGVRDQGSGVNKPP